jgi:hypothetical protein
MPQTSLGLLQTVGAMNTRMKMSQATGDDREPLRALRFLKVALNSMVCCRRVD